MPLPAPISVDGVELSPPAPGRLLPPRAFTSTRIRELEETAVFARSWVHVADLGDVARPGDYQTASIGATPVVVVRGRDGELRGFINACRHRGAQLLDGHGQCARQITCPYHAWSYGTDGRLIGVPYRDEFDPAALADMNLVPIRVGVVGPLVFGCLDPTAPSLDAWVGALPADLAAVGAGGWRLAWEQRFEVDANWKLFVENANDGYHIPVVHDILTDVLVPDSGVTTLEAHGAFTWAGIKPAYVPPGRDPASARVRFGTIFPNLIPVLSPVDLTYLRVDPVGHDRLRLLARSYDAPLPADAPVPTEPMREFRRLAFARTTEQDIAVVIKVQRGLQAASLPAGTYASRLEERIAHFERLWAAAMRAAVTGTAGQPSLAVVG